MKGIIAVVCVVTLLLVNIAVAEEVRQPTPAPTPENQVEATSFDVIERYPDGQPMHANMTTTKKGYELKNYTIWWNSYGQVQKLIGYRYYDIPNKVSTPEKHESSLDKIYQQELEWLNSTAESHMPKHLQVYFDEAGELVAYSGIDIFPKDFAVASNKTPLPVPKWNDISTDAKAYKSKMGVSNEYMFDAKNYNNLTDWINQQTPEYQQNKTRDLELQLAQANQTLIVHESKLEAIWNYIKEAFNFTLW